jgi:hypothetical protein
MILKEFDAAMESIANRMITSSTLLQARNIVIQYLESGIYSYCLECLTLDVPYTGQPTRINRRNHTNHFTEPRAGYKSKMWNINDPYILPHDFTLIEENLCSALWEKLQEKGWETRLQFWNGNTHMLDVNVNKKTKEVSSPSGDDVDGKKCSVVLEPVKSETFNIPNDVTAMECAITNNNRANIQYGVTGTDEEQEAYDDVMETNEEAVVRENNDQKLRNNILLQKLQEMEDRILQKVTSEQKEFSKVILNQINKKQSYRDEIHELKAMIQNQNNIILNRFNAIEQKLPNMESIPKVDNAVVPTTMTNTMINPVPSVDHVMTSINVCTPPYKKTVYNNGNGTNPTTPTTAANNPMHGNIEESQPSRLDPNCQKLQEMELQLRQLTRERDQLRQERDDALLLTKDMEKELYRVLAKLDDFIDKQRTNIESNSSTCTTSNYELTIVDNRKKQKL